MYNLSSILIIILGIFQSELNWVDFCDESVVPWLTFGNRSTNPDNWCYNADLPAGLHNSTGCKVCHAFLGNWQTDHIEITLGKNLKTFKFQKIVRTRGYCRCLCPCHTSTALIPTSQIRQKKMMIIFSSTFSLFPSFHYFRLSFCSFFLSFFSLSLSSLSLSVSLSLFIPLSLSSASLFFCLSFKIFCTSRAIVLQKSIWRHPFKIKSYQIWSYYKNIES